MSASTVLYIVDGLGLSGKTKAMVDLITGLDPARYRARVICFDTESSPLEAKLRSLNIPVEEVRCPDGINMQVVARVGMSAYRLRPDVIHCYNPRPMLYGGAVARLLNVRGTLGTLSAFACLTPDQEHTFLPQKLLSTSWRNRLRTRLACRMMGAVVAVSPKLGQGFCRYNGVDPARLRVIPYGVDLDRFTRVAPEQIAAFRERQGLTPGDVVVGSVARLVEQKDYPTQLRAFAQAAPRAPALRMLLVGDGPLRASLESLARELGVADRVRFVGHTNEVPVALRALDMFVLASKFEPYGVALLEAKAAGVAIVATRVNEVPEILGEGALGRLVPPQDPAALADAFVELAGDAGARRALGQRAAADAALHHDLGGAIRTYQGLYDQVRGAGVTRNFGAHPASV
jgi:glycosyltransferase involved in cell wall biosynthesis